ncbi:MAG: 50S ribosomal protein L4, partial [Candidatus Ryanbacteria bacterium]|nr:50S ribosomal protein L4 [Candidatus Ryanbacteria bacterium]
GEKIGTVELSDKVFAARWRPTLVHETLLALQANRRAGTAHAKGRGEVRGGGKKPWRQKGTGRARHGSIRSPIWVGGGVAHGPVKEKNYSKKVNKQAARTALASALSQKLRDGEILFVDKLALTEAKTKRAFELLRNFGKKADAEQLGGKGGRTLLLLPKSDNVLIRSFRNLPYIEVDEARNINVEKTLTPKYLIFTKEAAETINVK